MRGRPYHHGRLKEALVDAARLLVAERGPAGFTLAEAAKLVGVTAAAPYRHFSDRGALLDELARQGFERFTQALVGAWDGGRPDAVTAVRRMGFAYLEFARLEPGLYSSMFGRAPQGDAGRPASGGDHALAALVGAMTAVLAQRGAPGADATKLALEIWSISHGVATLSLVGQFQGAYALDPAALLDGAARALIEAAVRDGRPAGPWGRV